MKKLGKYKIIRELGRGAMGVVYLALDEKLHRQVALKVLPPIFSSNKTSVQRFQREAESAAKLQHSNIVNVYDVGQEEDTYYYAMEYVEGKSLSELLDIESLSYERICKILIAVAQGLGHAHSNGVIHRDIKPGNIMITDSGDIKIADFGLAKVGGSQTLTATGDMMGTPMYMSPEQVMVKNVKIDHRTDIYSLGITMYEMLTLQLPFAGEEIATITNQIINKEPKPPGKLNSRIPTDLETICLKAIEKEPDKRYQSGQEFADDIQRFLNYEPIKAKPVGGIGKIIKWIKRNKVLSSIMSIFIIIIISLSIIFVYRIIAERNKAIIARNDALKQKEIAEVEKKYAIKQQKIAEEQKNKALQAKKEALKQKVLAEKSKEKAQKNYELAIEEMKKRKEIEKKQKTELKREWTLDFEDNFERDNIGNKWFFYKNEFAADWKIVRGRLEVSKPNGNSYIMLKRKYPGSVKLEFSGRALDQSEGQINCFINGINRDNAYIFPFGGWNNTKTAIEKKGSGEIIAETTSVIVKHNKWYKITVERIDDLLKYYINNRLIFNYKDPNPINDEKNSYIALDTWGSKRIQFDNVKVYKLALPQKMTIENVADKYYSDGNFKGARDMYLDILKMGKNIKSDTEIIFKIGCCYYKSNIPSDGEFYFSKINMSPKYSKSITLFKNELKKDNKKNQTDSSNRNNANNSTQQSFRSGKQMQDKYISFRVDEKSLRFIIKTTDGDPNLKKDQNKLLLYQMRNYPGTSFSTFKIDGMNYVYGDKSDGKIIKSPTIESGKIISTWKQKDVEITQTLSFAKGLTTGRYDSVKIKYTAINKGNKPISVGLRILLDTLLGPNDNAPFSVPFYGAVTTDKEFTNNNIPEYIYSYDDIENPTIRTQSTLKIAGIVPPDRVVLSNWKKMFKSKWNAELKEGRKFKNSRLSPIDSAMSIYWDEKYLHPGEKKTYTTFYGLNGAELKTGDVFATSLSGPVECNSNDLFIINADIQNILPEEIHDIFIELNLPDTNIFKFKEKNINKIHVNSLEPTAIQKTSWKILPVNLIKGKYSYELKVTAIADGKRKQFSIYRDILITL